jgi:uncharacterized protein YjbJ (UPF0337 family)
MSEFTDKAKGLANEVAGKVKQAIGADGNDPNLKAEGEAQEGKGHLQQAKGDVKGAVKGVVDKV